MKDQIVQYIKTNTLLSTLFNEDTTEANIYCVATYAESLADKQSVEFGEWMRERAKSDKNSSFGAFVSGTHTTAELFEIFKKERDEKHT